MYHESCFDTLWRGGEKNRFSPTGNVDKHPEMMKWFGEGLRDFRGIWKRLLMKVSVNSMEMWSKNVL
jgi:hypothetical protein